jgi:hypothetical protein
LGREGWELVCIVQDAKGLIAAFKKMLSLRDSWSFPIGTTQQFGFWDIYLKLFAAIGPSPDLMRAEVYVYIFGTFPE